MSPTTKSPENPKSMSATNATRSAEKATMSATHARAAKGGTTGAGRRRKVRLEDKFDLSQERVLLNGAQAVVRLVLMQRERDRRAGLNTAGYVTGYRGSPIAGLEAQFGRARKIIEKANIRFEPGLNEDLAATALWGAQQAELRGEGKYDGVFGVWYGKGPGVDRSGDVFRHANHAGTSKHGGVLALMGDDHTCESSTSAHQSEFAFVDAMIPVLNPAGVQEIVDFGLLGFALSRYAGVWVGIKCVKDNIESTGVVDTRLERLKIKTPDDFEMPEGGLNIRLGDTPLEREARLHDHKRGAILAFARANGLDRLVFQGGPAPRIGIVTMGKSYLDVREALDELGIDEVRAAELGLRLLKVGLTWPLEPAIIHRFAEGLETIIVVEEKRSLVETQIKEQLYGDATAPMVVGKKDEHDQTLFPAKGALEPLDIALAVGERLLRARPDPALEGRLDVLKRHKGNRPHGAEIATRIPYFCSGCPHNTSTVVPEGSRAYAGIGCHYMAQWMDRATDGFTHMGAEGVNWIGEAPFSKRRHVFQNLGDGTYVHSGSLAIRAALAAGVNITYKILYNDAVAMTGGQPLDGGMTVDKIARQVAAEGVKRIAIVSDEPEKYASAGMALPRGTTIHHRRELGAVQEELRELPGVTVLIYDQTCAAEKRRRRKRGLYPDPPKRAFINTAVCEGCGDCGVKSNCVSIVPVETPFGRKRQIDQSTCNKDYSCVDGFCPSFVTVHGGRLRKPKAAWGDPRLDAALSALPEPTLPLIDKNHSIVVTGVGGTGVVTISAILGQAAHIDGKGFGAIDMAGLAQKGGAVACHTRIAERPEDIHAIRAGVAGADVVLGCDLVVTASSKIVETIRPDHTAVVLNTHELITGDFTHNPDLRMPRAGLEAAIRERAGGAPVHTIDAQALATRLLGDSIASNMLMLGFAWQLGTIPVTRTAIREAIELNGVAVGMNQRAFEIGRLAAHDPKALEPFMGRAEGVAEEAEERGHAAAESLDNLVARLRAHLVAYQDEAYAARFEERVRAMAAIEEERLGVGSTRLAEAIARGLHKLMAYKDEYEVARLFTDGSFERALAAQFEGDYRVRYHLAPPLLARKDPHTGEPIKRAFGPWLRHAFKLLARLKRLRGTRLDPFGYTKERRLERRLLSDYEQLLDEIAERLSPAMHETAIELAELPLRIRGFGHVKMRNAEAAKVREKVLRARLRAPTSGPATARQAAA